MSIITLGSINPGKVSLFKVSASVDKPNIVLSYAYESGQLPPGLKIANTGDIEGVCGQVSQDKDYLFTVRATGQYGALTDTQQYQIRVKKINSNETANMYGNLFLDQNSRDRWENFVGNSKFFPNDSLYRPGDNNFRTSKPKFLFLSGINLGLLSTISGLLLNNNYNTNLYMGEIKSAQAKSNDGSTIYEVIYCELVDPNAGGPNSIKLTSVNLPAITINFSTTAQQWFTDNGLSIPTEPKDTLFINEIIRMQNEIKAGITVDNFEYLPKWMKTPQNDGLVIGYKLVLPIKYVKPGESAKILYRLQNDSTFDIKSISGFIDRWIIDKNLGTIFDSGTTTFNAVVDMYDSSSAAGFATTYDSETTTFDDNGTRFIKRLVTFDRKTPQDAQLMFNRTAITDRITHISRQRELVRTP